MATDIKSGIKAFKDSKKKYGSSISKWTDKQVLSIRDRMRKIARKHRGKWTLDFYESLQLINKESIKRKLTQKTA